MSERVKTILIKQSCKAYLYSAKRRFISNTFQKSLMCALVIGGIGIVILLATPFIFVGKDYNSNPVNNRSLVSSNIYFVNPTLRSASAVIVPLCECTSTPKNSIKIEPFSIVSVPINITTEKIPSGNATKTVFVYFNAANTQWRVVTNISFRVLPRSRQSSI